MTQSRLLVVHPDVATRELLLSMLQTLGHKIEESTSDRAAVRMLEQSEFDLVIAGVDPEDPECLELVSYIRRKNARVGCILLFQTAHPERTKEATRLGASAVCKFPMAANCLRAAVTQALENMELKHGRPKPKSTNGSPLPLSGSGISAAFAVQASIDRHGSSNGNGHSYAPSVAQLSVQATTYLGEDPAIQAVYELAQTVAASRTCLLLRGERGTGKTLLARFIHQQSPRRHGPFVKISCTSMKEAYLEVELFGQRGAAGDLPGKLLQASGGTIYIDEVAAFSPRLQAKLLDLIQSGEFEPVGASQSVRADVRVLLGTRENLESLVEEGQFRQDLYYRIGVVTLSLPSLSERPRDVERLSAHFRDKFAREMGKEAPEFSLEAAEVLRNHPWPGNIRELESAIERAVLLCKSGRVLPSHLGLNAQSERKPTHVGGMLEAKVSGGKGQTPGIRPLKEALEEPEKQIILRALEALNWNRQETARVLDINRTTLYKKMKKYGLLIDEPAWMC